MSIRISSEKDLSKLLAFLRVQAKGGQFEFPVEMAAKILEQLASFARNHNVSIDLVNPDDERIIVFTVAGALAGAAIGGMVGSAPGLVIGLVAGGVFGYAAAHIKVEWRIEGDQGHLTLV